MDKTPEVLLRRGSHTDRQKGPQPDPAEGKKRKAHSIGGVSIQEPGAKKSHKEKGAGIDVPKAVPTSTTSRPSSTPTAVSSPLALSGHLPKNSNELGEQFRKHLQTIIPDTEKGKGVVWKTHLPKDYPDSLGVYFPGYSNMQHNLAPSAAERVEYEREAFRVTSTAEERKMVEDDPLGALGLMLHYQHHSGVITGALWDKYKEESLRLEATPPGIPQSSATIIERDFYKDQMLTSNRLANIRLEEIRIGKKEVENLKNAVQKQHASLKQKEAELTEALAKVAEMEKEMAERGRQLGEVQEALKTQKEELPRQAIKKFLGSQAFTVASQISCDNLIRATIYDELKRLSDLYPFVPEHCGYIEIEDNHRAARTLPGWTWDEEKDRLLNAKGKRVKPPENFESVEPVAIPIPWRGNFRWPVDVNDPNAGWIQEEGEEDEGEEEEEHGQGSEDNPPDPIPDPVVEEDLIPEGVEFTPIVEEAAAATESGVIVSGPESAPHVAEETSPNRSPELQID